MVAGLRIGKNPAPNCSDPVCGTGGSLFLSPFRLTKKRPSAVVPGLVPGLACRRGEEPQSQGSRHRSRIHRGGFPPMRPISKAASWTETKYILIHSAEIGSIGYHFREIPPNSLGPNNITLFWTSNLRPRMIRLTFHCNGFRTTSYL